MPSTVARRTGVDMDLDKEMTVGEVQARYRKREIYVFDPRLDEPLEPGDHVVQLVSVEETPFTLIHTIRYKGPAAKIEWDKEGMFVIDLGATELQE